MSSLRSGASRRRRAIPCLALTLALGCGPATAQVGATQADAAGGCDGVKNGGFGFHTDRDERPWWQVDLGKVVLLDRVLVFNRCDPSAERAFGLAVATSDDGRRWQRRYLHDRSPFRGVRGGPPLTVALAGVRARFVRVALVEPGYLHLDEIEVYGAADPKVNLALDCPADQSSASQWSKHPRRIASVPVAELVASGQRLARSLAGMGVDTSAARARLQALAERPVAAAGGRRKLREAVQAEIRALALRNPLLDFERLLVVRRAANAPHLGLPTNWQGNCSLPRKGYADAVVTLALRDLDGPLPEVIRPAGGFAGDVDLHFDGDRFLFSSLDGQRRWQLFEVGVDGQGLRQLTPGDLPDVDHYDGCYLPDGGILFSSTAGMIGVPCVFGNAAVANFYRLDADGSGLRRLTFDQDHDWNPTVMPDGGILYTRWEYSDTPHTHTRLLFTMNPDGTNQREFYGSNSYWPTAVFNARPVPGHPSKVVGIVTGHHGVRRMGELVVFDPSLGQREASGAVQRIPGHGKPVAAKIADRLVDASWPKFLHPWPLSEEFMLVSCQPRPGANWGIYLADIYDNLVLLREESGSALLEPVPLRARPRPPVVASRVDTSRKDAVVTIGDIYRGPGLAGVPRGTIKRLRVFSYHFAYQRMGGLLGVVGIDGPWDVKRILGTVPVEEDGSARFRIPANTPISVQPLDAEGKAVQLMRSWMTAMPGEHLSCVGCHESQNSTPLRESPLAVRKPIAEIEEWYGPARGFSYAREVQPVIDAYCIECHDGSRSGQGVADLRGTANIRDYRSRYPSTRGGNFSVGYAELHRFVRRPGIESDYHLLTPYEFHADTTELVQLLKRGHHGVQLNQEAWDRLVTWIDLNTPFHGTWTETGYDPGAQRQRRRELQRLHAGLDEDPEADQDLAPARFEAGASRRPAQRSAAVPVVPPPAAPAAAPIGRQPIDRQKVTVDAGLAIELVRVAKGAARLGATTPGSSTPRLVTIDQDFWLATTEVTNELYARFDPSHDSGVESKHCYQFGVRGYPVNAPRQPVVRVSWQEATAFCRWLSERTGRRFQLPTEEQWEYACRAGAATEFAFGDADTDFGKHANLADRTLRKWVTDPYTVYKPVARPTKYDDWLPKDERFDDGSLLTAEVGSYRPNRFGLYDMHGNVAEWTRSGLRPGGVVGRGRVVARGGSWRDRPARATSSVRTGYHPWQKVFNVGFRVVCTEPDRR